jgi:hypothetical protein
MDAPLSTQTVPLVEPHDTGLVAFLDRVWKAASHLSTLGEKAAIDTIYEHVYETKINESPASLSVRQDATLVLATAALRRLDEKGEGLPPCVQFQATGKYFRAYFEKAQKQPHLYTNDFARDFLYFRGPAVPARSRIVLHTELHQTVGVFDKLILPLFSVAGIVDMKIAGLDVCCTKLDRIIVYTTYSDPSEFAEGVWSALKEAARYTQKGTPALMLELFPGIAFGHEPAQLAPDWSISFGQKRCILAYAALGLPQLAGSWPEYLSRALKLFREAGIDPTRPHLEFGSQFYDPRQPGFGEAPETYDTLLLLQYFMTKLGK